MQDATRHVFFLSCLRPFGTTGVQTSIQAALSAFQAAGCLAELVTPFASPWGTHVPVIGLRRLIAPVSPRASLAWQRRAHAGELRRSLAPRLQGLPDSQNRLFYAQCPVSARVAQEARRPGRDLMVMAVHFNRSQATEWEARGYVTEGDALFRRIALEEAAALEAADALVYASQDLRAFLERRFPALATKPGMVGANFLPAPAEDVASTEIVGDLIAVGSLEPRKNQIFLLQVLAAAAARGHRPRLTLVGDGQNRRMLEAEADRLGLAKQVAILGERGDVGALLRSHKIFVHSAKMESLGLALVEAMARGLPVLAGAVGGIVEVFDEGVEGHRWPLDDPEAAAAKLIALLEDPLRREIMGEAARQRFHRQFQTAVAAPRLLAFLDALDQPGAAKSMELLAHAH